jgi:hypothetical protein
MPHGDSACGGETRWDNVCGAHPERKIEELFSAADELEVWVKQLASQSVKTFSNLLKTE